MQSRDEAARAIESKLNQLGADQVHLGIFDLDGLLRDKLVRADKAVKLAKTGYPFCEILYGWDTGEQPYEDGAFLDRPTDLDPNSIRPYPFRDRAALCIADFAAPFGERSARNQAIRMVEEAGRLGFRVFSAFEFEFNLFDETPDTLRRKAFRDLNHFAKANRTYSLQTAALHGDLLDGLAETMERLEVGVDALHTELGPGCFEAPLAYAEGIRAPDDAALFKNFAKGYFLRKGLTVAFMSKISPELSGQSGHLHLSLRGIEDGTPAFADGSKPHGLSTTALHFIGGLLSLLPEMLAMCSHTVNAYKRMVPGAWAPTAANWGVQNRTAAVRVINDSPEATRVEFRVPSADTNPFLSFAMCLGAGLWGIRNRVEPPPPGNGNLYAAPVLPQAAFPRDLSAAAERLQHSRAAREIFGDVFVDCFVNSRFHEDAQFRKHVSEWEIRRYLEVV